jgi:hypothetical protein
MEIGNIILLIALIYGIIGFAEGYIDGQNSLNGRDIEHKFSFTIRCLVAISFWVSMYAFDKPIITALIIPIMLLINSVGVDIGFNKSVGYHIGYVGKSSEWDKFIRKTPIGADGVLYQMTKVFVAGVLFFIVLM